MAAIEADIQSFVDGINGPHGDLVVLSLIICLVFYIFKITFYTFINKTVAQLDKLVTTISDKMTEMVDEIKNNSDSNKDLRIEKSDLYKRIERIERLYNNQLHKDGEDKDDN